MWLDREGASRAEDLEWRGRGSVGSDCWDARRFGPDG